MTAAQSLTPIWVKQDESVGTHQVEATPTSLAGQQEHKHLAGAAATSSSNTQQQQATSTGSAVIKLNIGPVEPSAHSFRMTNSTRAPPLEQAPTNNRLVTVDQLAGKAVEACQSRQ